MPAGAVTLRPEGAGNSAAMTLSAGGRAAPADLSQGRSFDRLSYGEPEGPARDAVPTLMVGEGDRVHMRIINRNINDHPMHLHGHRVRVLSRNGEAVTGSTWWTDTLNIAPGETSPCHGTSH
jgi:FtsP/CotA-like multicopper oxidase with cupredoxin domain